MSVLGKSLVAALVAALGVSAAVAQAWPAKPVRIVVPSAAGSAPDIMSRLLAAELQKRLGQPVVAENKPGAGGALGADQVAKSAPDGYALVMGNIGSHAMNVGVYPKLPYNPLKDFEPVAMVAVTPSLMSVSAELPVRNVAEFVDYARREGEAVTFSSGGNGSSSHLAGEYLNLIAGLKMRHVPYKDVPQALGDVAARRVTVMISNLPPAMSLVRAGKLRPLAVTTRTRSKALPEVPTIAETLVPGYEAAGWSGLVAPTGTPEAIIRRINADVVAILREPAIADRIASMGAVADPQTPEEYAAFLREEISKWREVARAANVRLEG